MAFLLLCVGWAGGAGRVLTGLSALEDRGERVSSEPLGPAPNEWTCEDLGTLHGRKQLHTGRCASCSNKATPRRGVPRQGALSHRVPWNVFEHAGRSSTLAPRVVSASQFPSRPMPSMPSSRAAVRAKCRSKPMRWSTASRSREPQSEDMRVPPEQGGFVGGLNRPDRRCYTLRRRGLFLDAPHLLLTIGLQ